MLVTAGAVLVPEVSLAQNNTGPTAGSGIGFGEQKCPAGSTPRKQNYTVVYECIDDKSGEIIGTINVLGYEPANMSCGGTWNSLTAPMRCWTRAIFAGVGRFLIWLGVEFATIAGMIFETVLTYTIVEFGKYLGLIKDGIDTGWTALRDIANILIIGMFVFIAISIILGVKEFGDQKKVAHVLIVAVLINFSLLFTKIIVDASNFTAYQFYNQMVKGIRENANQTATTVEDTESATPATPKVSGIAGKFMKLLGAEGFIGNDYAKLRKIAEANNDASTALGYGLISFIFLIAVSLVLLYGTFLILSRAVMIVFLMLTSAVAFATWLIPSQHVQPMFSQWWESLLKTAFFAPILMALLWITIVVAESLGEALKKLAPDGQIGVLGALATDPSNKIHILALLNFVLVLGLLYAAFAVSSAFSKIIPGFRSAQTGLRTGVGVAALTALAGPSRLLGLAGRTWIGGNASAYREGLANKLTKEGRMPTLLERAGLRAATSLGNSSFDALSTKPAQTATKAILGSTLGGMYGGNVGQGGYNASMKRIAEESLKNARASGFKSEGEVKEIHGEKADADQKPKRDALKSDEEVHKKNLVEAEHARKPAETEKKIALDKVRAEAGEAPFAKMENDLKAAGMSKATAEAERNTQRQRIAMAASISDAEQRAQVERDAREQEARSIEQIARLDKEIEGITGGLDRFNKEIKEAGDTAVEGRKQVANAMLKQIGDEHRRLDEEKRDQVQSAANSVSDKAVARTSAHTRLGTLYGILGSVDNDPASKRIGGAAKELDGRQLANWLRDGAKGAGVNFESPPSGGTKK